MQYRNELLKLYMELVEDTESPRAFHIWSLLSGVSACLGRRMHINFGHHDLYPNLFTLLVGNAASRKSTAMGTMVKYLRRSTNVRFGPRSTGGKFQGLITAMLAKKSYEDDLDGDELDAQLQGLNGSGLTLEGLKSVVLDNVDNRIYVDPRDSHTMFLHATEFTSFVGRGNTELLEFLQQMYDGEDYDYKLKNEEALVLKDPLITLIGCTTPQNIAEFLPAMAIGQGFTSRIIFVFGSKKYKSVPRPSKPDEKLEIEVQRLLSHIAYNMEGKFEESPEALDYINSLYEEQSDLIDPRFQYYLQRRQTHLIKVAMCLAAARHSKEIHVQDYEEADKLLKFTEKSMPDALGEFGMERLASAKQTIIEVIKDSEEPLTLSILYSIMRRDLKQHELASCLEDLVSANKIQRVTLSGNATAFIPALSIANETQELMNLLVAQQTSKTLQ